FDYSVISDTSTVEFNINKEINQVISICGPDMYRASIHYNITQKQEYAHSFGIAKSGLKFALESGLVNEFVELITGFIENHTVQQSDQDSNTRCKQITETDTENEYAK
ncbi:6478_t:CDS:2, partial [Gigaspora margarita]